MKILFLFTIFITSFVPTSFASTAELNSNDTRAIIVGSFGGTRPRISEPTVIYHISSSTISINFGNQPIDDYTVTISSPFTDMDYFITSSYTTIPLSVDGISDYSIIIETAEGDVFEGVLLASDYSSVDSM